jgi:hypothetical protein
MPADVAVCMPSRWTLVSRPTTTVSTTPCSAATAATSSPIPPSSPPVWLTLPQPETVLKRLTQYHNQTSPIIQHYKRFGVLETFTGTESNEIYPRMQVRVVCVDVGARNSCITVCAGVLPFLWAPGCSEELHAKWSWQQ